MKRAIIILSFFVFVMFIAVPPFAGASSRKSIRSHKSLLIKAHIRKALGDSYADQLFADSRFRTDLSFFTSVPGVPRRTHVRRRPDYDYVFSEWSLARGRSFLDEHKTAFDREEATIGVPREIVDALLDIETQWGKVTGRRLVVVTLYTLAVARPNLIKPGWAEEQLIAFLMICKKGGIDPFSVAGSRTGAFGLAQFEPTSYTEFATRCIADGDPPDLFDDADAICSIANYIHRSGWGTSEASRHKAIWAYNHDRYYVAAVLDYADLMKAGARPHRYRFLNPPHAERAAK